MSKISGYANSVSALGTDDLLDVSEKISSSPDVYESRKMTGATLATFISSYAANIISTDGLTMTANRTHDLGSYVLTFQNAGFAIEGAQTIKAASAVADMFNLYDSTGSLLSRFNSTYISLWATTQIASEVFGVTGHSILKGIGTAGTNKVLDLYDSDTTPVSLWSFRSNGDIYQGKNSTHYAQGNSLTFDTGDGSFTGLRIKAGHTRNGFGENDILFAVRDSASAEVFTIGGSATSSSETSIWTKNDVVIYNADTFTLFGVSNFIFDVQTIPVFGGTGTRLRNTSGIYIDENTYINKVGSTNFCFDITGTTLGAFTSVNDFADATENFTRGFFSNDLTKRYLAFDDGGNIRIKAVTTTAADAELVASEMSFHIDEAGNNLTFKVKYSDGTTVKSGSVALT